MKNLIRELNDKSFRVFVMFIAVFSIFLVMFVSYNVITIKEVEVGYVEIYKIHKEETTKDIKNEKNTEGYIAEREEEIKNLKHIKDEMTRFIKFKGICLRYEETTGIKEDVSERIRNMFTLEEIYLMQRVIETECYQGDFMSKVNVASVILNRLNNGKFGNTINEIITSPHQFAYERTSVTYDTILALEYAVHNGDTTDGALFFHSLDKTDTFNNRKYLFTDDMGHHFYG